MSKKDNDYNSENQEPWEQPIYDTEYDDSASRSQQRKQKRGNSLFLTIVLVLLFLIVAIPAGAGIWGLNHNNRQQVNQVLLAVFLRQLHQHLQAVSRHKNKTMLDKILPKITKGKALLVMNSIPLCKQVKVLNKWQLVQVSQLKPYIN